MVIQLGYVSARVEIVPCGNFVWGRILTMIPVQRKDFFRKNGGTVGRFTLQNRRRRLDLYLTMGWGVRTILGHKNACLVKLGKLTGFSGRLIQVVGRVLRPREGAVGGLIFSYVNILT